MPILFLEAARGLAALWVFAFHIYPMVATASPAAARLAAHGHLGVVLFFVISGYCLYSATAASVAAGRSPAVFLKRRFLRIFPPFWISIAVVLALPYLIEAISSLKSGAFVTPSPAWLGLSSVDWFGIGTLTRVFAAPAGDLQAAFSPVNSVYWTLAIEFQFYLVMWGVLFFPRIWRLLLVLVLAISLIPATADLTGLFLPYWPAFSCGLALRYLHERGWTAKGVFGRHAGFVALAGLFVLLAAGLAAVYAPAWSARTGAAMSGQTGFILFSLYCAGLLWCGGGVEQALTEHAGSLRLQVLGRALLKPFLLLGASSYSLYLLHGKLYLLPDLFVRQLVPAHNPLYPIITMALTAALCYLFYRVCEAPFMSARYQQIIAHAVDPAAPTGQERSALALGDDKVVEQRG